MTMRQAATAPSPALPTLRRHALPDALLVVGLLLLLLGVSARAPTNLFPRPGARSRVALVRPIALARESHTRPARKRIPYRSPLQVYPVPRPDMFDLPSTRSVIEAPPRGAAPSHPPLPSRTFISLPLALPLYAWLDSLVDRARGPPR